MNLTLIAKLRAQRLEREDRERARAREFAAMSERFRRAEITRLLPALVQAFKNYVDEIAASLPPKKGS
jgi:hypothetical protein